MLKTIKRISPLQLGKVAAVLYGLLSLVLVPLIIIPQVLTKQTKAAPTITAAIVLPIAYTLMGFVVALVTAALYNWAVKWVGGIKIDLED